MLPAKLFTKVLRAGRHDPATSREDILTLLEPVVMTPLRRRWEDVRAECDAIWAKLKAAKGVRATQTLNPEHRTPNTEHQTLNPEP